MIPLSFKIVQSNFPIKASIASMWSFNVKYELGLLVVYKPSTKIGAAFLDLYLGHVAMLLKG
jgi:hypothetical protein